MISSLEMNKGIGYLPNISYFTLRRHEEAKLIGLADGAAEAAAQCMEALRAGGGTPQELPGVAVGAQG